MRAQVVIEFFFAVTVFFLIITWLSNYASTAYADESGLYLQQKSVASAFASLASRACASGANITFSLPCVSTGNQTVSYQVIGLNTPSVTVRSSLLNASADAVCRVAAFVEEACGANACVKKEGELARIDAGAC
ncbi:MAG: hypothetical protein AB1626_01415 [Candidatus Micrarchaeota archaeon]